MPRTPQSQWGLLFNPFGGGLVHVNLFESSSMLQASLTLAYPDINVAPSTFHDIVPSPGASKIILPIATIVQNKITGAGYGNIDAAGHLALYWHDAGDSDRYIATQALPNESWWNGQYFTQLLTVTGQIATLLPHQFAGDPYAAYALGLIPSNWFTPSVGPHAGQNLEVRFHNGSSGNLTGGNPGDKIKVTVNYLVIDTL